MPLTSSAEYDAPCGREGGHEVSGDGPEGEERADDAAAHLHQLPHLPERRRLIGSKSKWSDDEVAVPPQTLETANISSMRYLCPVL